MQEAIFENGFIRVLKEESHIPWLKIFTAVPYKELTDCPEELRHALYRSTEIVEKHMRSYYAPAKINIAMFGNYLPHLHIHIMSRFKEDAFFPEPMWGKKQRDPSLALPDEEPFLEGLVEELRAFFDGMG
ncbi:MAG: HIT domain-containing protein [Campylobacteraceae bacterium]|jgi:diadenosine tetraphosphate (Ap4A) HIT family hydrolase|nr:HIT domain-containing protein [Campylobacteraceae bacterium]